MKGRGFPSTCAKIIIVSLLMLRLQWAAIRDVPLKAKLVNSHVAMSSAFRLLCSHTMFRYSNVVTIAYTNQRFIVKCGLGSLLIVVCNHSSIYNN